jgi:RNA polymerase sigma-70 factor, ECF subfamily
MWWFTPQEIERLCAQDPDMFARFYTKTVDGFFRFLKATYAMDDAQREDLLSDFYLKCRRVLGTYNAQYSFEGYVWTIFRNFLKDHFKKHAELHEDSAWLEAVGGIRDDDMLGVLETDYAFSRIQQELARLDEVSQQIIVLKFIEEKTYEEISAMLACSVETLRKRVSRALQKLRDQLSSESS